MDGIDSGGRFGDECWPVLVFLLGVFAWRYGRRRSYRVGCPGVEQMRIVLIVCVVLLCGCSSYHKLYDDAGQMGAEVFTQTSLWTPGMTIVRLPDGSYHMFSGESAMGTVVPAAALAYGMHEVGDGLKDSGTNVTANQGQGQIQNQDQIAIGQ